MLGNPRKNGLVAQLGAHHIRIVGVEGSNPFKSTITGHHFDTMCIEVGVQFLF